MAFASFFFLLLLLVSAAASHLPDDDDHHHHHHHHHHRHGRGEASAVSVVGSVLCDQCFHQQHEFNHQTSSFLSGAKVGIECKQTKKKWGTLKLEASTGEDGRFQIEMPPSIAHSPKRLRGCKARLLKSPDRLCSVKAEGASSKAFAAMSLKSVHGTSYVYTAGSLVFHPSPHSLNPTLCNSILDHHHIFKTAFSTPVQNYKNQKDASFPFNIPIPPIPGLIPPPPPPAAGLFPPIPFIPPIPSAFTPPIPFLTPPSLPSFPPLPYVPPLPPLPLLPPLPPSQLSNSKPDRP